MMNQFSGSFWSAVIFYTRLPLPASWTKCWQRIARWASLIGLILGLVMGFTHRILLQLGFTPLVSGAVITGLWLGATGGLHLDGAMDSADGLAVTDPQKRLEVMRDSATGAFGAMVAIVILLLKAVTISDMTQSSWLLLMLAMGWSRWGQLIAIALYPYLRATGKGAFHKEHLSIYADISLSSLIVFLGSCSGVLLGVISWGQLFGAVGGCSVIAISTGYYFYRQLGGHTGDTYGAVVEWSEVFSLLFLSVYLPLN